MSPPVWPHSPRSSPTRHGRGSAWRCSERRPHLAGLAGAALCRHALETGWCVRIGSTRAVQVTPEGERALAELLGLPAAALH
ncbi:hypothetical protein [Microbispora sp. NBC_01389]|uniref:hypothetical protein n=1 Tax=Microbispora sp. NBC_01389 TaxID=2903584 RepID=UPI0038707B75